MFEFIVVIILILLACLGVSDETKISGGRLRKDVIKNLDDAPRSRSEAVSIKYLEELMQAPFPSVKPSWLNYEGHMLELDGYNKEKGVAFEFQGPHHTKFFPREESYSVYFDRLRRDKFKIAACKKHNVVLIILDMRIPPHHWKDYIWSRLADAGKLPRPAEGHYLNEQTFEPYRNHHVETELGLLT